MGEKSQPTGRERLAQMQENERERKKKFRLYGLLLSFLVVLGVAVCAMWLTTQKQETSSSKNNDSDSSYIAAMTSTPDSTFDKIGTGKATPDFKGMEGSSPMLDNGKPRILYVGAEFCPYCAMDRWSLVMALSRFGSFKGLAPQLSSPNEGDLSNIPTVTFRNASYESKYISFKPYETSDRNNRPLMQLSDSDNALYQRYGQGGIPWINWAGVSQSSTPFNDPSMAGKSGGEVAKLINNDSNSDTTQMIIGAANIQTAKICQLTKGKPVNVCSSKGVKDAGAKL